MADPVEMARAGTAEGARPALPRARVIAGEQHIARLLKLGALVAGACFGGSLLLEALPESTLQAYAIDALRKSGVVLLVATPILRLVAAGTILGLRGEYRYTLCAATILLLLSLAIGMGLAA